MPRLLRTVLAAALVAGAACKHAPPPGAADRHSATAMGDWKAWRDLSPLLEVARGHAPAPALKALSEASALLRKGKARSADERLAAATNASGHRWIAVARADLAALHFTLCIRGVAWRLEDGASPSPTERAMDFSEETRVEPGDISVEALLTSLDDALSSEIPALAVQARIARARVAAFSQRCAANDDVAALAQRTVEADLATLAAEGHLTPDLAYLWAGVQMNRFSGAAARPFLLQAREGGFDHPAVTFMLGVIALGERNFPEAERLARESLETYKRLGDEANVAEAWFVLGEIARTREDDTRARNDYARALEHGPLHIPSLLASATLVEKDAGELDAVEFVEDKLPRLVLEGPLDEAGAREVAENLESLVMMATEPAMAQIGRDALLSHIEKEKDPMRRGLRYFYAATLDVRLREYEVAHGHGVLAKEEFAQTEVPAPIDIEAFLQHLTGGAQ